MANLQGKKISNTYEGLIKTENNSAVSGSTVLTDGAGNSLQITVNTNGTLAAQTITASNLNVSNWDEAYSWGDHSLSGYATSADVANAVNDVINAAPAALDTLDELAAALGDDANFATTITNLITGVSDRVTVLENAGFITVDTNTQLSDSDIAAMGYIKVDTNTQRTDAEIDARIALNPEGFITSYVDTNTQLTDAEIAAMGYIKTDTQLTDAEISALGYIKTDTNTQRTDAEIDARIALNPEGFITSYVDTNTQLSDADIAAMGYIKTDTNTQLSDADIAALGYIKTDTNTQRTDSEIDARIALNPEGFLTSETDSQTLTFTSATGDLTISNGNTVNIPDNNTQLSDGDIAAFGYIKTDTNTQRTDAEINTLIDANTNNFISDYTVIESDVTAHEGAITITESQISDLSHFSGSYDDLTDKPAGILARSDEEIEDVIGAAISGSGATSVVYNDAAGTIVVSSTDTNTQLTDAEISAFGYIKTDTNTQLSDADIAALGYIKVDTNTQLTDSEIAAFGYIKTDTNTQLSDSDIAAFGYIKTDTNTQRSDAEIQAIIDANSAGFITTYVDTNTQLSDADIAALGYIKTDTNTQLSDSDIAAFGYIKTDTNTQRTDAEINALITTGISGLATETYVDNAVSTLVASAPNTLDTLNELADALGDDPNFATTVSTNIGNVSARVTTLENANYISDYTVTEGDVTAHEAALTITESQISDLSHFSGSYNDLTDKPSGVTPRTDEEIEDVVGSLVSGTGATTVTYNDASGTLTVNSTDTNTQLSDAQIAAMGYIKTDTNTQLSDSDIANFGYIKTDTNTQRTDAEIISVAETEGFTKDALPLSGGTLTGDLEIFSTNGKLKIETTSATGAPRIMLNQDGVQRSRIEHLDTNDQLTLSSYYGDIRFDNGTAGSATNKMIIKDDGNVGIGTDSPDAKLEIESLTGGVVRLSSSDTSVGSGESIGRLEFKSNDVSAGGVNVMGFVDCIAENAGTVYGLSFGTGFAAAATEKMRINSSGSVGIGTDNPATKLEVEGGDALVQLSTTSSSGNPYLSFAQAGTRRSFIQHDDTGNTLKLASEYGGIGFYTGASGAETEKMTIESGGNVGIGETDPDAKLHISGGDLLVAGDYSSLYVGGKTNSSEDGIRMSIDNNGSGYIDHRGANNLNFRVDSSTGATTRMVIEQNGNVGIGETDPDAKLAIYRTASTYAVSLADTEARAGLSVKSSSAFDSKLTISSGGGSRQYIQAVNNDATTGRDISINPYGGDVGIGETSPDAKLHIKRSNCGISSFNSDTNLIVESGGHNYVNICSGDTSRGELWFSDSTEGRGRVRYDHTIDELQLWVSNGKKADLDGAGNLTITGNLTENSDARLKENVSTIENALDKVNSLRGVEYNMIADDSKTKKIGFIAQEIEEVIPELVSDDGDVKSVAYSNTVALLVESIKELTDKVNDLQGQIDAMHA